jgi:general secretion pathway protein J
VKALGPLTRLGNRGNRGFTLLEALVSVALMSAIVASLSAVTGQWLPNWHRGFGRVQRLEMLDIGLQRLVADLEAAEFVTPNSASQVPVFLADAKSVTLVRVGNAPGSPPHLEFVKFSETVDERGFALVRSRAPFKLLDPNRPAESQLFFADPVVLVRAPFRISFAFAGADRVWRDSWRDVALLPSAVHVLTVRPLSSRTCTPTRAAGLGVKLAPEWPGPHSFSKASPSSGACLRAAKTPCSCSGVILGRAARTSSGATRISISARPL